jgi:hypothetical protein
LRVDWCPLSTGCPPNQVQAESVLSSYATPTDFWITSSPVYSWLSGGDKDIFRLNVTSQKTVTVSPSLGDFEIVMCAFDFTPSTTQWFFDCPEAASSLVLAPSPTPWTLQVYSRSPHDGPHGGNYVHYMLTVE